MKVLNQNQIDEIVQILNNDGIVCIPTDTVYGICAKVYSKDAKRNLENIKNRSAGKYLSVMCNDLDQIKSIAYVTSRDELLIKKFMPGKITIVLNTKENFEKWVNNKEMGIAVRMAPFDFIREIINKLESPIYLTSANISGEPVCNTIDEVKKCLPDIDAIVCGEIQVKSNISSTVIDCKGEDIKILREGPISIEELNNI